MTKFKKGDRVEIQPGTVKWKPAVYAGRVWFVGGHSSCGLHLVDFRKSPKAATERVAVEADRLRRAPKLVPPKKIARPAAKQAKKYPVLKQRWTEHERGWGSRPDGETLHLTREDRDIYVRGYNATYKKLVAALTSTEVRHPWAQRGISA